MALSLDYTAARQRMVDAQIRPLQINDPRIVQVMRDIPREKCVPDSLKEFSYIDGNLPLGGGRVLTEPRITGRMIQMCEPVPGETVLVVGAGVGYTAVLFAALGLKVTALEENTTIAKWGKAFCAEIMPEIHYQTGSLKVGVPRAEPYDLIYIDGAVQQIPDTYISQLSLHGRLATVLWPEGSVPSAVLATHSEDQFKALPQFDAILPLLPELQIKPVFRL